MKGLKTLGACWSRSGLLAGAAPATAGAAGLQALRRLRDLPNAKPAHACPKGSKKGAFFKSLKGDVIYRVCVKFPTGKHICAKAQEADQGTLYVNKITSTIPGKHRVTWFVEGKKVGSFVFRVKLAAWSAEPTWSSSASTPRPPTPPSAPGATARSCTSRSSASPRDGSPRHATAPARRGRGAADGGRRLGRGRADRRRARAGLVHRPADRHRHRARAGGQPRRCRRAGSARSTRSARGIGRGRERRASAWRSSTATAARSSRRSTGPPASGSGSPLVLPPRGSSPSGWPSCRRRAVGRRLGGGTISCRAGPAGRPHPGRRRPRPPGRRAAHLRSRGGGGRGAGSARPDLPETSRRGALA